MHLDDARARRGTRIPIELALPFKLIIHHVNGNVKVRAADRTDVRVDIGAAEHGADKPDGGEGLALGARGNHIRIRTGPESDAAWNGVGEQFESGAVFGQIAAALRGGGDVFAATSATSRSGADGGWPDVVVEVPRSMSGRVEVHCASGDAEIEGVSGEIGMHTISGDLRAAGTRGALTLQTTSGDINVEHTCGGLTARTASGDVRIVSGQVEGFDIKTAHGDIEIDAVLLSDDPCRAQTASGDVRLAVRQPATGGAEPNATLTVHTMAGDVHVRPPFRKIDRQRWQSGVGDHGPRIHVSTVDGDLTATITAVEVPFVTHDPPVIVRPDDAAPTKPSPNDSESAAANVANSAASTAAGVRGRLAVLEAVERGEIDVEEALRQIEAEDAGAGP